MPQWNRFSSLGALIPTRHRVWRMVGIGVAMASLVLSLGLVQAATPLENGSEYLAFLTGAEEVPPVETGGFGLAMFEANPEMTALAFVTGAGNIENIVAAHIHLGPPGMNGPIVLFLYSGAPRSFTEFDELSSGVGTADDLVGPLMGSPLSELLAHMDAGNTYTNFHTTANPGGEIRGQNFNVSSFDAPRSSEAQTLRAKLRSLPRFATR